MEDVLTFQLTKRDISEVRLQSICQDNILRRLKLADAPQAMCKFTVLHLAPLQQQQDGVAGTRQCRNC